MYRVPRDGHPPVSISMGDPKGEAVHFVCGFLGCDARPFNPLLTALPPLIVIKDHSGSVLASYVRSRPGGSRKSSESVGQCVLGRLSELMFVRMSCAATWRPWARGSLTDWLAGLRDPLCRPCLSGILP